MARGFNLSVGNIMTTMVTTIIVLAIINRVPFLQQFTNQPR